MKNLIVSFVLLMTLTAVAAPAPSPSPPTAEQYCHDLINVIIANHHLRKVELLAGSSTFATETLVLCTYKATIPEPFFDRTAMVTATVNITNSKYELNIN